MNLHRNIVQLLDTQERESIILAGCLWLAHCGGGEITLHGKKEYTLVVEDGELWIYVGMQGESFGYSEAIMAVRKGGDFRMVASL